MTCTKPGNIPRGKWSCQRQELPIPDTTYLDGDAKTYSGEYPSDLILTLKNMFPCKWSCDMKGNLIQFFQNYSQTFKIKNLLFIPHIFENLICIPL